MPLDLRGFYEEPNQWAGLYQAANLLQKRKDRADQLSLQRDSRRAAAGTFLNNYLDRKELLTGTQLDPLILQGIDEGLRQGAALVQAGADSPSLMVALGPMVNKLNDYSAKAKAINKNVDDYIGKMKESGLIGYDFAKLKDEALRNAFYKPDAQGQMQLNPDQADPSVNWTEKAIELSPEKVTSTVGWDTFADKAKMKEEGGSETNYDRFGNMNKHGINLKYQEYMVPEWEKDPQKGDKVKGFVPKYQTAVDGGSPIMHTFTDENGKQVRAAARVLDNDIFDGLPKPLKDDVRGKAKQHIQEYESATGEKIPLNSEKAKIVERALAYDELNRPQRNFGAVKPIDVNDKPSEAMANLAVKQTKEYLENVKDIVINQREGKFSVPDPNDPNRYKRNIGEIFRDIYTGKEKFPKQRQSINGELATLGGKKRSVKDYQVFDVTGSMPKGGLQAGSGVNYDYKRVFFRPEDKTVIIEQQEGNKGGGKDTKFIEIPEADLGDFMDRVAEPNGVYKSGVPDMFDKIGYKDGKFGGAAPGPAPARQAPAAKPPEDPNKADFEKREKKGKTWRVSKPILVNPFPQKNP